MNKRGPEASVSPAALGRLKGLWSASGGLFFCVCSADSRFILNGESTGRLLYRCRGVYVCVVWE